MVKTGHHHQHHNSISWQSTHQQQVDYYMNMPINQTSIDKEIYPWMNEKKYGNNKKHISSGKIIRLFIV
jgi:hypothetical protein